MKNMKAKIGAGILAGLMLTGIATPAEARGVSCPTNCVKVYATTYTRAMAICNYAYNGELVGGDGPYAGVKRDQFGQYYRWCQK